jgi:hypothetical protein
MNHLRVAKLLYKVGFLSLLLISAAQGADLEQEYAQVRTIAMKDPKVRAAFERAQEILDKRIIEIDPSLKKFVDAKAAKRKRSERIRKTAQALPGYSTDTAHVVTKGETLTSVARRYGVSVDSLAKSNKISKEGTLRIGQRLVIARAPRD